MKVLSALLLTFIFILTGCSNSGSGQEVSAVSIDTSKYLRVAGVSASNNTPVPIEKYVLLTFSSSIDETTVDESSVYIEDENSVPVPSALAVSGEKISIIPYEFFLADTPYTIVVTTAVEDTEGRTLENTFTSAFVTASLPDTTAPLLVSVTPDVNAEAVKTTNIVMEFDEIIAGNGVLELTNSDTNLIITGTAAMNDTNLSFVPDNNLDFDGNYTVTLQNTVEDLAGNVYTGLTSWDFSIVPEKDTVAPSLVSLTPDVDAVAAKTTHIVMEFDEYISGNGSLQLTNSDTNIPVPGVNTLNNNTLSFVPDNDLVPGNNYTVTMQGIVEDLAGNEYIGMSSWSFSIIPASELKVVSVTHTGRVIRVVFSEDLNTSTVNESDFAINGGSITFHTFLIKDEIEVQFIADSNINGDENISVSGTIQDINGVNLNNGVTAIYPLGFEI